MRKIFNFLILFIPAYILAMLLYTFCYQPHKAEFHANIKPIIASFVSTVKEKLDITAIEKNKPERKQAPATSKKESNGSSAPTIIPEGKLRITVLDVKHGDAILLQDSKQTILVDTGHNANREVVLKRLAEQNIKKINTVIVTHHHADHMGNIFQIAGKYGVGRIYDNGLINKNNTNSVKLGEVLSKGSYKNKRLSAGDKISFGDGFYMDVLAPGSFMDKKIRSDLNCNSIVMKLHYGKFTMLFTGDIENGTEVACAAKYGTALKSDVLKVAHHGSSTSSNYQFISKVTPQYALISCVQFEEYHHPNKKVVGRLEHIGAKVYSTQENGNITIVTDGRDYKVQVVKK